MISVDQALSEIFELIQPVATEEINLSDGLGRVLASSVMARRDQPPFAASAMDGYAVKSTDLNLNKSFDIIGESAAGHGFNNAVNTGETVRIFTGAPLPPGADQVVIQENATRSHDAVTFDVPPNAGQHIRPAGADFKDGDRFAAPKRLGPNDLALLASMNIPRLTVYRRPTVALVATGDELVWPGENPSSDQIIASNSFGLAALVTQAGGTPLQLEIARDNVASLTAVLTEAKTADVIVTIGGASVGDHDLVGKVAAQMGLSQSFYKVAMRPGKPLMAGKLGNSVLIGLPGNPVSSMVCAHVFLLPAIAALQGLPAEPAPRQRATLATALAPNGMREHYMRAHVENGKITPYDRQDSALLSVLGQANALLVNPASAAEMPAGSLVFYLPI